MPDKQIWYTKAYPYELTWEQIALVVKENDELVINNVVYQVTEVYREPVPGVLPKIKVKPKEDSV